MLPEEALYAIVDERVEVGGEGARHTGRADHVLEDQVPSDDECHELADRDERVDVSRAGAWYSTSELGVAQTSEDRGNGGHQEREDYGWARNGLDHHAGQDVDTSAQSRSDPWLEGQANQRRPVRR